MDARARVSLVEHLASLEDPRVERTKLHSLMDLVVIAICAVICDANSWTDVEDWGDAHEDWLREFLDLRNGIPSHDTFGRVFSMLDPDAFSKCLYSWLGAVAEEFQGKVVAIDGKTLRGSFDRASGLSALHVVSAYVTDLGLVVGQVATEAKSNEIKAIPELLQTLSIRGCIVTIDAMGCQREIARQIVAQKADYVLGLKGNQGTLHDEVAEYFDWAVAADFKDIPHDFHETVDKDHGRIETRRCLCTPDVSWFEDLKDWEGLRSFIRIESTRTIGEQTSTELRYYISSLDGQSARDSLKAVRQHWGIENQLHWTLDVVFHEDLSRVRNRNEAQNFTTLRRTALDLLKRETTYPKRSIRRRRKLSAWRHDYLLKVLSLGPDSAGAYGS